MKCVLKAIAISMVVAALACLILEYWDELTHFIGAMRERTEKLCKKFSREDAEADIFAEVAE